MSRRKQDVTFAWPAQQDAQLLGRRIPRIDGPYKATGRAKYTYDIIPAQSVLLYARMVTCPHGHARITAIDTSAAEAIRGVRAVQNIKNVGDVCEWDGDPILAVAADRDDIALDAANAVRVEYEVLDHWVGDDDPRGAGERAEDAGENVQGDPDAAFADADVVVEGDYGIQIISHMCLEPHGAVCMWRDEQSLTAWLSTQNVSGTAGQFVGPFGMDASQVEVICDYIGGGFGSKFAADSWGVAAAQLARSTGRAVKLMLDRATELKTAGGRPSAFLRARVGAMQDGTLVAWESEHWGTGGPGGGGVSLGVVPYIFDFPNYRRRAVAIRTNTGPARAWRAPNHPQACAISQTAIDDVALALGMDSLELFRRNLNLTGRPQVYEQEMDIGAELIGWADKWHPHGEGGQGPVKQGLGLALHTWGGAAHNSTCTLRIHPDGGVETLLGSQDLGTGTRTAIAITIAETLGLPVDAVHVRIGSSRYPISGPSGGSTTIGGVSGSNRRAAQLALAQLFERVAPALDAQPSELVASGGRISVAGDSDRSLAWREACGLLGMTPIEVQGANPGDGNLNSSGVGGVQMADVSVDTETGIVRINQFVAVQDCGLIIDLLTAESQVYGGVIMGIAYALSEERIHDPQTGEMLNDNLVDYKLPRLPDVGEIIVHMLQTEDEYARGVVGLGEPPVISPGAAISNAVCNAIGVRVPVLPLTPQRVLAALEGRNAR